MRPAQQILRGPAGSIPVLDDGQPGWTTDTHVLYVGQGGTNYPVGGGGGGSLTIGQPVGGSTPDGLLYVDAAGNLAEGTGGLEYAAGVIYEPLCDPAGPSLVFAGGDVIMVPS